MPPAVSEPVPALVTLHLWRVSPRGVAAALALMGRDRIAVRRTAGVRFAKMLGTGDGRTFTVRDADPLRWGLLAAWTDQERAADFQQSTTVRTWSRLARESWRIDLVPVTSRGTWSGRRPFGDPSPVRTAGPVAAITRARLTAAKAARFWSAVPPVSTELHRSPGLLAAVGIGEAPIGLQGTFSLWSSADALNDFAHGSDAHRGAVRRTPVEGWYAEELFARFRVVGSQGSLMGVDPLA